MFCLLMNGQCTQNPSWEAIHFTAPDHCKYAALSGTLSLTRTHTTSVHAYTYYCTLGHTDLPLVRMLGFTIKVWISHYHGYKPSSKNSRVVLEKNVHLVDLAYLGTKVSERVIGFFNSSHCFAPCSGEQGWLLLSSQLSGGGYV